MDLFTVILFLAAAAVWLGLKLGRQRLRREQNRSGTPAMEAAAPEATKTPGQETKESIGDFNWEEVQPRKLRPFKPIYHITMALQADAPSELITIDSNYKSRVEARRFIMASHASTVMGFIPAGVTAVQELYSYLLSEYLPSRYSSMFSLFDDGRTFRNLVTGREFACAPPSDPLEAWRILGETVEDDLFLLYPSEKGHLAVAFLCCFPSGFDPSTKLGKLLSEIHEPVPAYEKIGPSMERFFARLEAGKSMKRVNWSVQTSPDLFAPSGNHVHADDVVQEGQDVDIETTQLRIELQTLSRLPKTKAILFSFKTYLYPVKEIKEEGLGELFADAIDGLKHGNAPGMWVYKGGIRWGKSICAYLRS